MQHPLLIMCVSLKASELDVLYVVLHEVVEKTQLSQMNAISECTQPHFNDDLVQDLRLSVHSLHAT